MAKKRVLIASPVHQYPSILSEFLVSLVELDHTGIIVSYLFMDDNAEEESSRLLTRFSNEYARVSIINQNDSKPIYIRDEYTHFWRDELIWKVAGMKDAIIDHAKKKKYDYLFLVDSDLVLHPNTLLQLISAEKDIIANIFWTSWQPNTREMPQVWVSDEYTLYEKKQEEKLSDKEISRRTEAFLNQLRQPGIYEVGGLGACTLISKQALDAGVQYEKIKDLSYWGEDRHFCRRAMDLGFSLYVDTHYPAYHIYRKTHLAGVNKFKRKYRAAMNSGEDMITISLCMIVKNEEDALERCLSSVKEIADEIIIVDTGSTDRTKEIASKFTDKIYDFEWIDDFSAARNYAFNLATQEYILWLDADDIIEEKDCHLLFELKRTIEPSVEIVTMHYQLVFDEKGNPTYSMRRNRLVRRECGFKWIGSVHEYLAVSGKVIHSEIAVKHKKEKTYTDRNLQIYRRRMEAGEDFNARDLYYFANELRDNAYFEEAALYYEKFLNGKMGWLEDNISACLKLANCHDRMSEHEKQLHALLRTLEYDKPRAEACCRLGFLFLNENQLDKAIFWFDLATTLKKSNEVIGMVEVEAWTWLPHLQLCVCYDRLGDLEKARHHNDIALSFNPTHPSMLYNKRYFEKN